MNKKTAHSLSEMAEIASDWVSAVAAGRETAAPQASIIGLSGHLGSGKTAFVQLVAKVLGVNEAVTSPTFVIMKIYDIPMSSGRKWPWHRLVHMDAYRLKGPQELSALDFEALVSDAGNLIMIEWPENISAKEALPDVVGLEFLAEGGDNERTILI